MPTHSACTVKAFTTQTCEINSLTPHLDNLPRIFSVIFSALATFNFVNPKKSSHTSDMPFFFSSMYLTQRASCWMPPESVVSSAMTLMKRDLLHRLTICSLISLSIHAINSFCVVG